MPTLTLSRSGACQPGDRVDHGEPGPYRPLGIVLMRLRVSEINEYAVAHIFRDKAIKPATTSSTAR